MFVRNEYVLSVRTLEVQDMGYNLKRDGWLNNFVDAKNQSMREGGVPWRGAREKGPNLFSILFSALTDKEDIIVDWQCGVGMFFIFLFFILIMFVFYSIVYFYFIFWLFSYPHLARFVVIEGSVIARRSIQQHIVALETDIDIYKSVLLPMREPDQEHTFQHLALQRGSVFDPPPRKMAKRNFDLLCAFVVCSYIFIYLHFYFLDLNFEYVVNFSAIL